MRILVNFVVCDEMHKPGQSIQLITRKQREALTTNGTKRKYPTNMPVSSGKNKFTGSLSTRRQVCGSSGDHGHRPRAAPGGQEPPPSPGTSVPKPHQPLHRGDTGATDITLGHSPLRPRGAQASGSGAMPRGDTVRGRIKVQGQALGPEQRV